MIYKATGNVSVKFKQSERLTRTPVNKDNGHFSVNRPTCSHAKLTALYEHRLSSHSINCLGFSPSG